MVTLPINSFCKVSTCSNISVLSIVQRAKILVPIPSTPPFWPNKVTNVRFHNDCSWVTLPQPPQVRFHFKPSTVQSLLRDYVAVLDHNPCGHVRLARLQSLWSPCVPASSRWLWSSGLGLRMLWRWSLWCRRFCSRGIIDDSHELTMCIGNRALHNPRTLTCLQCFLRPASVMHVFLLTDDCIRMKKDYYYICLYIYI